MKKSVVRSFIVMLSLMMGLMAVGCDDKPEEKEKDDGFGLIDQKYRGIFIIEQEFAGYNKIEITNKYLYVYDKNLITGNFREPRIFRAWSVEEEVEVANDVTTWNVSPTIHYINNINSSSYPGYTETNEPFPFLYFISKDRFIMPWTLNDTRVSLDDSDITGWIRQ